MQSANTFSSAAVGIDEIADDADLTPAIRLLAGELEELIDRAEALGLTEASAYLAKAAAVCRP